MKKNEATAFDFTLELASGKKLNLKDFEGTPLIIVNTATRCGLAPQFEDLEKLYQDFANQGLHVVGIPSNQFAGQEPESNETLGEFCKINHGVTFPLTKKSDVNGPQTNPLLQLLKQMAPGFLGSQDLKWNFTKFLVSPDGRTVKRFAPSTPISVLRKSVEKMLRSGQA